MREAEGESEDEGDESLAEASGEEGGAEGAAGESAGGDESSGEEASWTNDIELWKRTACRPTLAETGALETIREEMRRLESGEEEEGEVEERLRGLCEESAWLQFLSTFLVEYHRVKREDTGMTGDLVGLLMRRIEEVGCVHGPSICAPQKSVTAWGEKVHYMHLLINKSERGYLLNVTIQEMCRIGGEYQGMLQHMAVVREKIERIRERCESESSRIDSATGELVVNRDGAARLAAKEIREFLTPGLSHTTKALWLAELESAIATCAAKGMQNLGAVGEIVTQGGIYDVSGGVWRANKDAWREHPNVVWNNFDVQIAKRCAAILRDPLKGNFGQRIALCLEAEGCVGMSKFLDDSFPDDIETWGLVFTIMGYCMLRENPYQVCFNFHGITRTGKTTLASLICELIGRGNYASLDYGDFGREYEGVIKAVGKLVMFVDEAEGEDVKEHARVLRTLKKVTSDKPMSVRGIYKAAIETRIGAKILMTTNKALEIEDTSGALQRRMIVLKFDNPAVNPVESLELKILQGEHKALCTLAMVALRYKWNEGRRMFDVAGSVARTEGALELAQSTDKIRAALDSMFIHTEDEADVVPWALVRAVVQVALEQEGGRAATERTLTKTIRSTLKIMGIQNSRTDQTRTSVESNRQGVYTVKKMKLNREKLIAEMPIYDVIRVTKELSNSAFVFLSEQNWAESEISEAIIKAL